MHLTMPIKGVLLALPLIAPATLTTLPPIAHAADGMLYEVSEAIDLKSNGTGFKSSEATLSGAIRAGTPLCPSSVATVLRTDSCWAIVHATGGADNASGVGPIRGTMFVVAELLNSADAPELKILSADFDAQLDLSPAFFHQIPRGTIAGKYSARGENNSIMAGYKAQGSFQGVFRLPFLIGQQASYLLDDGRVVPLEFSEYSVGRPTPRLEVTFTNTKSTKK
jgi:hypothetical protein